MVIYARPQAARGPGFRDKSPSRVAAEQAKVRIVTESEQREH